MRGAWRLASSNEVRSHASLKGHTPLTFAGGHMVARAELNKCPFGLPLPGLGPAPSGGLTTNSRRTRGPTSPTSPPTARPRGPGAAAQPRGYPVGMAPGERRYALTRDDDHFRSNGISEGDFSMRQYGPFLVRTIQHVIVGLALCTVAACGGGNSSPTAPTPPPFSFNGTWTGPITSNVVGPGTGTVTITQTGSSLSGTWATVYPDPMIQGAGSFSGTASGMSLSGTLSPSDPTDCPYTINATVSGNLMTGTYATFNCTGVWTLDRSC